MTKPSIGLQDLRRRIYLKAKADQKWRFWGLYVHVCKPETLREAYPALFLKLDIRDRQGVAGRRTGFRHRHLGAARGLRGEPWGDGRAR